MESSNGVKQQKKHAKTPKNMRKPQKSGEKTTK